VYHASGQGTGLIVDAKGLVVTNRHVVGLQSYVDISDAADRTECGQVVLSDADVDYAFVLTAPWDVEPLKFREMSGVREGETVVAIGHPLGYSYTVSKGIVSSKGRRYRNIDYLQTDAPINPGNSGGPLLNEQGDVIGINTWIRSDAQGVGFAFPIDYVKRAMARLNVDFNAIGKGYYCNLCGFLNFRFLETSAAKYCTNCGAPVVFKERPAAQPTHTLTVPPEATTPVSELTCMCCKTVNPGSQKYCQHCGATLRKT
jgi:serine protease Do